MKEKKPGKKQQGTLIESVLLITRKIHYPLPLGQSNTDFQKNIKT